MSLGSLRFWPWGFHLSGGNRKTVFNSYFLLKKISVFQKGQIYCVFLPSGTLSFHFWRLPCLWQIAFCFSACLSLSSSSPLHPACSFLPPRFSLLSLLPAFLLLSPSAVRCLSLTASLDAWGTISFAMQFNRYFWLLGSSMDSPWFKQFWSLESLFLSVVHRIPQASLFLLHPSEDGSLNVFLQAHCSKASHHHHHGGTTDEVAAFFLHM